MYRPVLPGLAAFSFFVKGQTPGPWPQPPVLSHHPQPRIRDTVPGHAQGIAELLCLVHSRALPWFDKAASTPGVRGCLFLPFLFVIRSFFLEVQRDRRCGREAELTRAASGIARSRGFRKRFDLDGCLPEPFARPCPWGWFCPGSVLRHSTLPRIWAPDHKTLPLICFKSAAAQLYWTS